MDFKIENNGRKERPFIDYKIVWLTVNRACNLRCKWCYAQGTNYKQSSNMDFELAKRLIDLSADLKINHITLIGGEPTIYPNLLELIDYIHYRHLTCGFASNGLEFKHEHFVKSLVDHGIERFSISLKGENREIFKDITGADAFTDVLQGIKNCLKYTKKVGVSMVLTNDNIPGYLQAVRTLKNIGIKDFRFSFFYEFDTNIEYKDYLNKSDPRQVIEKFKNSYADLDVLTNHRFELFQTYPLCLWDEQLIKEMDAKGQLTSVCQLLNRHGLLFDEQGNIIPCNAMYSIKLAKYGEDFNTAKELLNLRQSDYFVNVYKRLCGLPDASCQNCKDLLYCGGGCVCQWTNYSFDELMKK